MRTDAAEDAEDRLHEERRLDELALEEMRQRVEMTDVVALELEARAVLLAELAQHELDVLERVAEDEVAAILEVGTLPGMLEFLVALEHREQAEVHRAHVERGDLGLELFAAGGQALVPASCPAPPPVVRFTTRRSAA